MCDRESFRELRNKVTELEKNDIAQTEQIRTLFNATSEMKDTMKTVFNRILWIFCAVLLLAILALVYGALGDRGFNAVTAAAGQQATTEVTR